MNKEYNILKSLLLYFYDDFYEVAITNVRDELQRNLNYQQEWTNVVRLVIFKNLPKGEAMNLVHNVANVVLDENSDEEAYKWLLITLFNASCFKLDEIIKYKNV